MRIHFVHVRSRHAHAVPLLLIPPFPLTNLSLAQLVQPLSNPEDTDGAQPFHLVIPSIPGLGFSDAFTSVGDGEHSLLLQTAELFNTLMLRLGYKSYIASATGGGRESPAGIDYHLARLIGEAWGENCLGVHLINPLADRPRLRKEPLGWIKLSVASFFHASIFGYEAEDFAALRESKKASRAKRFLLSSDTKRLSFSKKLDSCGAAGMVGLREPNTLAYALCDSPVGLLSWVCSVLRRSSPSHALTQTEIIDLAQLAWLPGPEAGMRFWASTVSEAEESKRKKGKPARVSITVFGTDGVDDYVCPAWVGAKHEVVFAQRLSGNVGLLAWEKTGIVVEGIRGLFQEVAKREPRLNDQVLEEAVVEQLNDTITEGDEQTSMQLDVESPDTIVAVQR